MARGQRDEIEDESPNNGHRRLDPDRITLQIIGQVQLDQPRSTKPLPIPDLHLDHESREESSGERDLLPPDQPHYDRVTLRLIVARDRKLITITKVQSA